MNTKADNDNNEPWISLGLAAAMILNRLRNDAQIRDVDKKPDANGERANEEKDASERENIERRLRELAAIEDGLRRKRRKI